MPHLLLKQIKRNILVSIFYPPVLVNENKRPKYLITSPLCQK